MRYPRKILLIRCLVLSAITATVVSAVLGQATQSSIISPSQEIEEEQAKTILYKKFLENSNTDQLSAYVLAREYLQKFPQETDVTRFLRKWVDYFTAKEKMARKFQVKKLIEEKRFSEAFVIGRAFLVSDPNDIGMLYLLIQGGMLAVSNGDVSVLADATCYSKRALQLIESGQVSDSNRNRTLGWLNLTTGFFSLPSAPAEAAKYFYKTLEFDEFKKDAFTYSYLADAILGAEYLPLQREFSSRFITPEQRLSAAAEEIARKLNRTADYIIDALARAIALAGSNHELAQLKLEWMRTLISLWEFRNSGYQTGLNEYIEEVLAKPMPSNFYSKAEVH
ncbi:MAG TPA: hypothetical protein VFI24_27365 [Pyrinomonadaceae bacterium]|nr:hypothetical protein [Pyrinomonadaceae bacterium]